MYFNLTDRVVVVTGASSGSGAATARLLHATGALPVLAARRVDQLSALSAELDGALSLPTDVVDRDQLQRLVEVTLRRYGRIDALVNNAGACLPGSLEKADPNVYRRGLDLHVVSVLAAMQAVLPVMRRQRGGRIVNVSAGAFVPAPPEVGDFAASSATANMIMPAARDALKADGIDISLVVSALESRSTGRPDNANARPEWFAHSADHIARVILHALCTGEERLEIPYGPDLADLHVHNI